MNKIEIVNTTAETEQTQNKLCYECKKEYDEDHSYENYSMKDDNRIYLGILCEKCFRKKILGEK